MVDAGRQDSPLTRGYGITLVDGQCSYNRPVRIVDQGNGWVVVDFEQM